MRALRGEVDKMQSKSVNGKRAQQPRNGVCLRGRTCYCVESERIKELTRVEFYLYVTVRACDHGMRNVWEYTSAADSYTSVTLAHLNT